MDFEIFNRDNGQTVATIVIEDHDLDYGDYSIAADKQFLMWCSDNGLDSEDYDWEWM
jgi:hypothetical protein